ncbi:acetamidase/formamidase family protein [Halobacillus kuroshimensis]|uniref:Acetamidase/formamidase family protein n=1 Tax=Halobacillus kuroshimensis TaxID=302481 RepID=A0ABS3DV94_9BACI|nr:acetamidase/formamidase family protein [Halobacillus kuroshimensis]MBN8235263.1 acetamidase/formamidase family protein [Halobacillus kuroshimensis]
MTVTLSKEHFVYAMDKDHPPALHVSSGATIQVHTNDCFEGQIQSEDTEIDAVDWNRINPATGPVYIEEAEPGDTLKVTIQDIQLGDSGVMVTGPDLGVMGHRMEEFQAKIIPVENGKAVFNKDVSLPLNPMIGVIGVAPEGDAVSCGTPGAHGGNMDTKEVTTGASLYFPVFQKGALLSLGDLHAAMGDGEISVSGVEIPAEVSIHVEVIKDRPLPFPFLKNEDGLSILVSKETLDEAVDTAVELMIDFLQPQTDLSLSELTMLMSAAGQVQVSQVVDPLKTARFFVPNQVLEAYSISIE